MQVTSFLRRVSTSPLPLPAGWYAIPLRLIVGLGFLEHGYAKLSRGADGFIAILHAIGMPFAELLGWVTILVEIVGGLFILSAPSCQSPRCR
jgi:putative oxidoreductase